MHNAHHVSAGACICAVLCEMVANVGCLHKCGRFMHAVAVLVECGRCMVHVVRFELMQNMGGAFMAMTGRGYYVEPGMCICMRWCRLKCGMVHLVI
jgi:hypothetical protein